jgi:hypothetical protein
MSSAVETLYITKLTSTTLDLTNVIVTHNILSCGAQSRHNTLKSHLDCARSDKCYRYS